MVEFVQDDAGLSSRPAFFGVEFDDVAHVAGEVDDDGVGDGLAGEAGAAAAGEDVDVVAAGGFDDGDDVVGVFGQHNADGFDLVDAGVGAV